MDLTRRFPGPPQLYASTFIWAAVIGLVAHGVPIRPVHVAGMACLIVGMFLMGR